EEQHARCTDRQHGGDAPPARQQADHEPGHDQDGYHDDPSRVGADSAPHAGRRCRARQSAAAASIAKGFGIAFSSSCVYSCWGLVITSLASPCSTTRPWWSTRILSASRRALSRSWVM